ncbi:MAG: hypothetical protein ACPW61_06760 [Methyloligella sp. ZOD6]
MLKYVIAIFAVAFLACTGAQAAPQATSLNVSPAVQHGDSDLMVEVGKKWKKHHYKHYKHHKRYKHYKHHRNHRDWHYRDRHYHHHHRYRRPPPGWYRYNYRPYGWSRRGCLAFGPVWYCP